MPNRIIRESCRSSPNLAGISGDAERLFWRLTTVADDHGRFESESPLVSSSCFPRQLLAYPPVVTERLLGELVEAKLILLFEEGDRRYGQFINWTKHQRVRAATSKYPPPTKDNICKLSRTSAVNGAHPHANAPVVGSRSRDRKRES